MDSMIGRGPNAVAQGHSLARDIHQYSPRHDGQKQQSRRGLYSLISGVSSSSLNTWPTCSLRCVSEHRGGQFRFCRIEARLLRWR
jgi:hypothetical protein